MAVTRRPPRPTCRSWPTRCWKANSSTSHPRPAHGPLSWPRGSPPGGIEWQFPAGIIKPGRASAATATEETFNETGIHCEPIKTLGWRIHPVTQVHCEYVLCRYLTGEPTNRDSVENFDALWVERDAVTGLIPEDQMFSAILDLLRAA